MSGPGAAARTYVCERDGNRCRRCGHGVLSPWRHLHHRRRRSQGGTDGLANLVLLCARCHREVHAGPRVARNEGWLVGHGGDPERIPVLDTVLGWVLFDDDGGVNLYDAA